MSHSLAQLQTDAEFEAQFEETSAEAYDQAVKPLQQIEEAMTHNDLIQSLECETPSKLIPAVYSGTKSNLINPTEQAQRLNVVLQLEECHDLFRSIMPPDDQCTYVVEKFLITEESNEFDTPHFETTFRLNLHSKELIDTWLDKFMESSKCIYRVTKTTHPSCIKVYLPLPAL